MSNLSEDTKKYWKKMKSIRFEAFIPGYGPWYIMAYGINEAREKALKEIEKKLEIRELDT